MAFSLGRIGQIALAVRDVDRAEVEAPERKSLTD
jgi:hypothetical protein